MEMGAEFWTVETMEFVRRTAEERVNNNKKHTRPGVNTLLYTHISLPSNDKVNIFVTFHFTFQELTPRLSYPLSEFIQPKLYVGQPMNE